jgi:hypothetical protein
VNDFVSRLELELRSAAVRQETAGVLRRGVLPRARLALPALAGAAAIAAVIAVAIVVAGSVTGPPTPERATVLPAELEGSWRLVRGPGNAWADRDPGERAVLRFLPLGSARCASLYVASPCYVIDDSVHDAQEWGTLSVSGDELTLRYKVQAYYWSHGDLAQRGGTRSSSGEPYSPGVYRWRVRNGSLRLTKIRDSLPERPETLTSGPHSRVRGAAGRR